MKKLAVRDSIAFFGISFIDTSTEGSYFGERADEALLAQTQAAARRPVGDVEGLGDRLAVESLPVLELEHALVVEIRRFKQRHHDNSADGLLELERRWRGWELLAICYGTESHLHCAGEHW